MRKVIKRSFLVAALAASSGAGSVHAAVAQTWTFENSSCTSGCPGGSSSRDYASNAGGILKARALYTRGSDLDNNFRSAESAGGANAILTSQDPNGIGLSNWRSGDSEFNVPNHAIDNINNRDFVLLDFGEVMDLTSFSIGWKGGDSDMSVLFAPTGWDMATQPIFNTFNGSDNATSISNLINGTITGSFLAANQWSQQNFSNVAVDTRVKFASGTRSRYALVSGALTGDFDDAFKLKTFSVPNPGTLALIGLGLGLLWFRQAASRRVGPSV